MLIDSTVGVGLENAKGIGDTRITKTVRKKESLKIFPCRVLDCKESGEGI